MKTGKRLLGAVQRGMQNVAYGNPIYRKILASGEAPERLVLSLPDPWPGDSAAGMALISQQRSLFDSTHLRPGAALRNLRAVGSEAARLKALDYIEDWLDHHDEWNDTEWSPEKIGDRIAGWIGFYDFYAPAATPNLIARMAGSLHRQWKHVSRTLPANLTDLTSIRVIKGLVYGGLNFDDGDQSLALAIDLLKRQLQNEILPDGGHISRCPSIQLHMLRGLIDLREAFKAGGIEAPDSLRVAIHAMLPTLKFFRHGDGGLALFHGSGEESSLMVDAAFTLADAKCRTLRRLPDTGYERVTAGRSLLIADVAAPPPRGYDRRAHAGLLSFEFGQSKERLIVNCGALESASPEWHMACASTAAHSTMTIDDSNACDVLASGGIKGDVKATAQRYEEDNHHCIDMRHNGYAESHVKYRRLLRLSASGEELSGQEELQAPAGHIFALRWHLHPSVQASLGQSGQTALLRTASGLGWRLRIDGTALTLESSIYCGSGSTRRTLQIKASGVTRDKPTNILWNLTREKM
jgi:uncharacterized heparinase superfamily protein